MSGTQAEKGNHTLGQTATYQSVIIALVAGAILVIALFSIIWRRRRRMQFLAHVDRARNARDERYAWVELGDGRLVQVRDRQGRTGGKKKGSGVGKAPVIWDVGLGNRGKDEYEDDTDMSGEVKRAIPDDDEKEVGEVGVDGSFGYEWKPLSATVPDYAPTPTPESRTSLSDPITPGPSTRNLDMSILIAMPSPHAVPPVSASSSSTSLSYSKPPHLDDYPVQHDLELDSEYLPVLEIGYTSTRVSTTSGGESAWADVVSDIDARQRRHRDVTTRSRSRDRDRDRRGR